MIHSILLIGQSNMAGRGILTDENRITDSRMLKLVNCRWQTLFEPVTPDRKTSGASIAPTFGLEYLKYLDGDDQVGFIPAADGGTHIAQWQKGEPLYENAVFLTKMAMKTSKLEAILWHQGESDRTPERIDLYKSRFFAMLDSFKKDINMPDIKIYVGGMGDYLKDCPMDSNFKNCKIIDNILREIAQEREDVEYVSAEGLTPNDDILHFNTESLREFGRRYFDVFLADRNNLSEIKSEKEDNSVPYQEHLEAMKAKKEKGEITDKEYDEFISNYISTL